MKNSALFMASVLVSLAISCAAQENMPPRIEVFEANPSWGEAPLITELYWKISDPENDPLECFVDFDGDGTVDKTIENCASGVRVPYIFNSPGRFLPRLVASDGHYTMEKTTEVFSNHLVFADNVVFPEKMQGFQSARVGEDTVVLTFDEGAAISGIDGGDILWGTSGFGYIRKVTGKSISGSEIVIQTQPARIEEAVVSGIFGVRNYSMIFTDVKCLEDCEYVENIRLISSNAISSEMFPLEASMGAEFEFGEIPLGDGVVIKPKLHVSITIDRLIIDIPNPWTLREFTLDVSPSIKGIAVLEIPLGGVTWSKEIPLGARFAFAAVPLGPIVIVPNLEPKVRIELGLEPTLEVTAEAGITVAGGVSYKQGEGTSAHVSVVPEFNLSDIDVDLGLGEAKVSLIPGVSFLIFDLLGPFVDPAVYVKGSLSLDLDDAQVCVSGKAGAEARLGIELDLFFTSIQASKTVTVAEVPFFDECFGGQCHDCVDPCAGHCSNGVMDCGETGEDCGGQCTGCADPCAGHCSNGVKDCGETGEDCGGQCTGCADPCAGHCSNGVTDCGETGEDCGGECTGCADPCGGHCSNGVTDCGETGVDCGGECGVCTCSVPGHMGAGNNGDPCSSDLIQHWRCVYSSDWGTMVSQVCLDCYEGGEYPCDGVYQWLTFNLDPRDCEGCCSESGKISACCRSDVSC